MGWKIKFKKPKLRITIKKPKVTVGGDVGKAGGAVIRGATRAIEDFATAPLHVAANAAAVFNGKPVDDAFRDALRSYIKPVQSGVDAVAVADAELQALGKKVASKVGGDDAAGLFSDVVRLLRPFDTTHISAGVASIDNFIETGKLEALNPIAVLFAGEVIKARNELYPLARAIAPDVIAALPESLRARAKVCRVMAVEQVPGNVNLPDALIRHIGKATAVCVIDVIVYRKIPGSVGDADLFLWCHELHHAQQYAGYGVQDFARRYVADIFKGKPYPDIEEDADLYACNFFPKAIGAYVGTCPV